MWCHCRMLEVYSPWDFHRNLRTGPAEHACEPAHDYLNKEAES